MTVRPSRRTLLKLAGAGLAASALPAAGEAAPQETPNGAKIWSGD
jgi:hypothetical protein